MSDFNYAKYNTEGTIQDPSDALANHGGFVISFYHLISEKTIKFKAYITNFNESYSSDYAAETVFGRGDPIYAFRNTTRQIALTFQAPASSTGEAYENLAKAQQLVQFLYPAYAGSDPHALTIAQSPLVRLKIMNLVANMNGSSSDGEPERQYSTIYDNYSSADVATNGLLGAIQNVTIMHNIENPDVGVFEKANNTILPKVIEIQLNFAPIHEHTLGWLEDGSFAEPSFPYGATTGDTYFPEEVASLFENPDQVATDEQQAAFDELMEEYSTSLDASVLDPTTVV